MTSCTCLASRAGTVSAVEALANSTAANSASGWNFLIPCMFCLLVGKVRTLLTRNDRAVTAATMLAMSAPKILFGFHAVTVRLKTAPQSIVEIHVDATRRDQRMRQFVQRAKEPGARLIDSDDDRLQKMCGTHRHQGVVARVNAVALSHSLDDVLDAAEGEPLVLVLDGITDPHNLGACLRVADAAGAHPVVAPKDHALGINATLAKL